MSNVPRARFAARALAATLLISACTTQSAPPASTRYEDLTALFAEWRTFQRPKLAEGVPDYTAVAMSAQQQGLREFRRRLDAIDPRGWPVNQQVDWYLVRAEMNGLDFDHRVLKPWAQNPAFYVTVFAEQSDQPAREGPLAVGAVELWQHAFPLSSSSAATIDSGLHTIPKLLAQARANLTGTERDLWLYGTSSIKGQSQALAGFLARLANAPGELRGDAQRAKDATDQFAQWLDTQAPSKTQPSGIGIENYDWYLRNVQLVPLTWRDEVTIMQRELARSRSLLVMEEQRNAKLPRQTAVASVEEHARKFTASVTEYMAFLRTHDVMTVRDDMEPALLGRKGTYSAGPLEFFSEVDYRDREVMLTHDYHWFDLARMAHEPHLDPIRRGPLLYNIFNTRTEGHATGWEELMLQAGMFDARPRSRELIYIMLAERAARALGDLRMQSNEFTLEEAAAFASANTPRGWLSLKGHLVRGEQHLYLQQPAYGTSYIVGKIQVEELLAARKEQAGDAFSMRQFMDEFNAAGLVPASLLRWELTGQIPDDVRRMLGR